MSDDQISFKTTQDLYPPLKTRAGSNDRKDHKQKSDSKVRSQIKALRDRIRNAKPSELPGIKAQLENLKLLSDSPEILALIESAIGSVDNKAANPDQTNQNLTLSRADILTPEMEEKAKIVDELYKEFKDPKFQQQLKDDIAEDKKKLADIKKLLDNPESITLEDRRRLSGDYLSDEERARREEEIRVKRERINKVHDLHDGAKELHTYHTKEAKKSKTKLDAHKKKMKPDLEKDQKELKKLDTNHKFHIGEIDKYKKIVDETSKIVAHKEKSLEDLVKKISKAKNKDNTELLKKEARDHFDQYKDRYYKMPELLNAESKIVTLLSKAGLTDKLQELKTNVPHLDLKEAIKNSEEVAGKQKSRANPSIKSSVPNVQKSDTAKESTNHTRAEPTKSRDTKLEEKAIPNEVRRSVEVKPTTAIAPGGTPKITAKKPRGARYNRNNPKAL